VFVTSALEALCVPRADIAGCDGAVDRLASTSWLGRLAHGAGLTLDRSWSESRLRFALSSLGSTLMPSGPSSGIRSAGWTIAVAASTALGLNAMKPMPVGPLSWIVPVALVIAGLALMAAAGPLARAHIDRRSRRKVS
jgi:hypothetical protein